MLGLCLLFKARLLGSLTCGFGALTLFFFRLPLCVFVSLSLRLSFFGSTADFLLATTGFVLFGLTLLFLLALFCELQCLHPRFFFRCA